MIILSVLGAMVTHSISLRSLAFLAGLVLALGMYKVLGQKQAIDE